MTKIKKKTWSVVTKQAVKKQTKRFFFQKTMVKKLENDNVDSHINDIEELGDTQYLDS